MLRLYDFGRGSSSTDFIFANQKKLTEEKEQKMARLTRKFLTALGIEDENVQDQIISAHTEATDALKEQRDGYKADAEKLPEVQKELDTLKEQSGDKIKAQYDKLKKDFDNYKEEQQQKELAYLSQKTSLRATLQEWFSYLLV